MSTINKKQKLMLEYAIADKEVFAKVVKIIDPLYFEKPLDRVCEVIKKYYQKHKGIPTVDIIEAETSIELDERSIDKDQISYVIEELEEFCQVSAMTNAVFDSVDLIKEGKLADVSDLVRKALMVKIDDSVGVELFDSAAERIKTTDEMSGEIYFGVKELDDLLNGIRKKEVGIVYGSTGAGKSVMLANMSYWLSKKQHNGLIVSLELKDVLYAKRMDCIFTGGDIAKHSDNADSFEEFYREHEENLGIVVIKRLKTGSTQTDIETVLLEYELKYGIKPDYLIVDYLALMGLTGVNQSSMNKFDLDELKIFELQRIADEWDLYCLTAGQLNRDADGIVDLSPKHVAGGLSAVNGSDWSLGLVATDQDIENNQFQLKQLKIRNGAKSKKPIIMYRCPKSLRVSDQPFLGQSPLVKKVDKSDDSGKMNSTGKDKMRQILKNTKR